MVHQPDFLIFHAFGGGGASPLKIKSSGLGGRYNGVMVFLCLMVKATVHCSPMPGQSLSLSHNRGLKKGYKLIIRDGLPYYEKKQPKVAHEEHSHKLELVKDGLTFLKRGALKRPATVAFFGLDWGL